MGHFILADMSGVIIQVPNLIVRHGNSFDDREPDYSMSAANALEINAHTKNLHTL